MKNILKSTVFIFILLLFTSCGIKYKAGTYIGVGVGYNNSTIKIAVTINNEGNIVDIKLIDKDTISENELKFLNTYYLKKKENKVSFDDKVSAISGATETSRGMKNALANALSQAMK